MRVLLKKLFLFTFIPALCWGLIDAILPITFFTHRHHEAITFQSIVPAKTKMYPNISSSMDAVGDLAYYTKYEIIKHETWKTDKLGYRNDEFIEDPDILFIGDSFIEGSSLNQNQTISNNVSKKLKQVKVYNMAPCNFNEFIKYLKIGVIKKPKLIIFSSVERNVPDMIANHISENNPVENLLNNAFSFNNINIYIDKALKLYSVNWIRARINGTKGIGIQSGINPNMFFYKGINQKYNPEDLSSTTKVLLAYKKYCDSLGIYFLFLPIPNKETVYYELVPFEKQPNYLLRLDSLLKNSNIPSINTLKIYNDYRISNTKLLYHFDDTHWNSNGVEIISNEIINKLNTTPQLDCFSSEFLLKK
ncbi:MAG: hypothetical protein WCL51_02740 [Bacteroidota bacterium]